LSLGVIGKRLVLALVAMAVLAVPAVVVGVAWNSAGTSVVILGSILALATTATAGYRAGVSAAVALVLLAPLALVAGLLPIAGACLMAVMCLMSGATALWGLHVAFRMVPLYIAFLMLSPPVFNGVAAEPLSTTYVLSATTMLILGCGWSLLLARPFLAKLPKRELTHNPLSATVAYTTATTVLCSVSTLIVLMLETGHAGAWLIMTLLIVMQVAPTATLEKTGQRLGGTVLGAALAAGISMVATTTAALAMWAFAMMVAAMTVFTGPRYWLYVTFLTPAVILLSSTPGNVLRLDAQRLGYTALGALLAVAASGGVFWYQRKRAAAPPPTVAAGS
jgi:hypothetical protein